MKIVKIMNINKILEKEELDGILVTNIYNIRYLSNFTGDAGFLFISKNKKILFTDSRFIAQAKEEVQDFDILEVNAKPYEVLKEYTDKLEITKLGIEDMDLSLNKYTKIKESLKKISLVHISDDINSLRLIKTHEEIEMIKKATNIIDIVFTEILPKIKSGIKENDIAAEMEYIMRKNGASDKSFETIVASGYRSAMPHGTASSKIIGYNEFVKLDFGCIYNGYCSDMTRTVYLGDNITQKHEDIYYAVLGAQELAIKNAKAGVKVADLDKIARDYIESKGFIPYGHGLGHGIGLEVHEMPSVSQTSETILEENMVVTIEPGIYIEGFGGVRIEDDILIKKDCAKILTQSSKELIILK